MAQGRKREEITFAREADADAADDGAGGYALSWVDLGGAWAEVSPVRATETERQGALRTVSVYLFKVHRARVVELGIRTADRLTWGGRHYNIREIRLPPAMAIDCDIVAETGVTL